MTRTAFRYVSIILCMAAGLILASCGKGKSGESADGGSQAGTIGRVEHETIVKSGEFELKAVVTVPAHSADQPVPGAVIVPSFDPTDRDGRFTAAGYAFAPYKDLADDLAGRGVATIRYDKRLIPPYGKKVNVRDFTLETYYDDVIAAFDVLRGTDGVDDKRLFLIGHGEGAVIATTLLEARPGLDVRGLVLIAPPMLPYDELIIKQHTMGIRQRELQIKHNPNTESFHRPIIERMRAGLDTYRRAFDLLKEGQPGWPKDAVLNNFYESYWRDAIALYAGTLDRIMGLKLPIYILQGNDDPFVFAEDLLRHERELWDTGHVKITLWDGVGHYLIDEELGLTEPQPPAGEEPTAEGPDASGEGPVTDGEQPGTLEVKHVSTGAAAAIAEWIKNPVIPPAPDHTPLESDRPIRGTN
jgi:pimeloyl-ACP methyl ester carboxylesterase